MNKLLAVCLVFFAGSVAAWAQQAQRELSIEESYLDEPIEIQIMREQGRALDRESKLTALDFIHGYMNAGNKTAAVREMLKNLSLQGTMNKELADGRLSNNYADVRWRAVEYLGEFPKEEVEVLLHDILLNDEEPEVAIAAINALAKVKSYEINSIIAIEKTFRKFDAGRPTDRLAIAVLDYYGGASESRPRFMADTIDYIRRNPSYDHRVRDKADKLLKSYLQQYLN